MTIDKSKDCSRLENGALMTLGSMPRGETDNVRLRVQRLKVVRRSLRIDDEVNRFCLCQIERRLRGFVLHPALDEKDKVIGVGFGVDPRHVDRPVQMNLWVDEHRRDDRIRVWDD